MHRGYSIIESIFRFIVNLDSVTKCILLMNVNPDLNYLLESHMNVT